MNTQPPEAQLYNTPLPELMGSTDALDTQVMGLLLHRGRSCDKRRSRRLKFIEFAQDRGYCPIPIPTSLVMYMRFMLWLPSHGITSGWKGCLGYATEVAQWNLQLGFTDVRDEADYWWSTFRLNFNQMVRCAHLHAKLPLRPHMILAILSLLDFSIDADLRDGAAYLLLYFTSQRIGHVAVDSAVSRRAHALRFESLYFYPSIDTVEIVFVCFDSTKTRTAAANDPFWTAIAAQPHLQFCPARVLLLHFVRSYQGDPGALLFQNDAGTGPLSRAVFTRSLRRRLAATGLVGDLRSYSGISFRRGALSTLGQSGVPSHTLADFADHASVQTSRVYTMDTMHARAATGTRIGQAIANCGEHEPPRVPACGAHALVAAGLFASVTAAFQALMAKDTEVPVQDRANAGGFSLAAMLLVVNDHSSAVDVGGPLAILNSSAIRATQCAVVLSLPGHYIALTPAPAARWLVHDNLSDSDRYVDAFPVDTQVAIVIGVSAIPALQELPSGRCRVHARDSCDDLK